MARSTENTRRHAGNHLPRKSIGALVLLLLIAGSLLSAVPKIVAIAYVAMSLFAALLYAVDKDAAVNDRRRTRESTLHFIALLGGWPGALFAQGAVRHKTKKASFQFYFWVTVGLNCCALAWLLADRRVAEISRTILGV